MDCKYGAVKLVKTWNIVLQREEKGTFHDWSISFTDAAEYVGDLALSERYKDDLIDQIKRNSHYYFMRNIKSVKSSTNDDFSKSSVGLILATTANDNIKFGFLFEDLKLRGLKIIALWPEHFANACKEDPDIHKIFIVRLVQNPEFFSNVSVILPKAETIN